MQSNKQENTDILDPNQFYENSLKTSQVNFSESVGGTKVNQSNQAQSAIKTEINKQLNKELGIKIQTFSDEYPNHDMFIEVSPKGRFGKYPEVLRKGPYKNEYKGVDLQTGKEIQWNDVFVLNLPIGLIKRRQKKV